MIKEALHMGDLRIEIPLIQGGMGIGISLGNLAGAVAKEGGVGIISSAQIGFREEDFDQDVRSANLRGMEKEYQKARSLAPKGVIGFNIMVALRHYQEHVKKAVELGADLIISGAGLPMELPKLVGKAKTKLAPIVSSAKSAKVLLKYWDKKYQKIPDLLVVEGPKAGGHLGFTKEYLGEMDKSDYRQEVGAILKIKQTYEEKYDTIIPIALAGGIYSQADAKAAFELGVDAIQVASRFITTKECDAAKAYKDAYLQAKAEDIGIVSSPVGMPGRAIKNEFTKKVDNNLKCPPLKCHQCVVTCNPRETIYCITDALIAAAKGNVKEGLLFCGAKGYKQNKMETVKDVIHEIMD